MEMYNSDMAVYINKIKRKDPEGAKLIGRNIDIMKQWAAENR
jgi:hypothetical protein